MPKPLYASSLRHQEMLESKVTGTTALPGVKTTETALAQAERRCVSMGEQLTPMRRDVVSILAAARRPVGAYEIAKELSTLQQRGVAPVAAYRALDFLMRIGLVTRVESRNAFMLCAHPDDPHDCIILMCSRCGDVEEIVDERLAPLLDQDSDMVGFTADHRTIEVHGLCRDCSSEAIDRQAGGDAQP